MADESLTLIVKHLPSELTTKELEDLLRHFGASTVKTMGNKGRMKHTAFATFGDHEAAAKAMRKLHQIEIIGRRLVVEFSNNHHRKNHPTKSDAYKEPIEVVVNEGKKAKPLVRADEIDMKKVADNVNSFARHWDIRYALDPRLEYMYPQPTVNILTNIANALASVPKFYVQVLHLMNKMNIPAPFGTVTPTPVLPEGNPVANRANGSNSKSTTSMISELKRNYEDEVSTEESELESDEDSNPVIQGARPNIPLKRKKVSGIRSRKRLKLQQNLPQNQKSKTAAAKPSDVFEQSDVTGPKKIAFNLSRFEEGTTKTQGSGKTVVPLAEISENSVVNDLPVPVETPMMPLPGAPPLPPSDPSDHIPPGTVNDTSANTGSDLLPPPPPPFPPSLDEKEHPDLGPPVEVQPPVVAGGFGKFEPVAPVTEPEKDSSDGELGETDFIGSKALRRGKISSSEKREHPVFTNYQQGDPSTRLYIKNIAKPVAQKDLHYIFGRYVDWSNEVHKNMFDIRLMKEGRMKGQAFVTLPSIDLAKHALSDTHGFMLHGKPIAVQFARSAKAKDNAPKKDEKKK